jgi:hypothetical protein
MSLKIGFVLLTHNKPHQAVRLVKRLSDMFGAPPIAWHHDFTQCNLPLDSITKNASLVRPNFQTGWAKFSVVEAMLSALKMLFESKNPPDWFILLSGADYPIKAAEKIAHDLSTSQYDVHIHHEKICFDNYERDWQRLCYERYCSAKFRVPFINRRLKLTKRTVTISHPLVAAAFHPFSKEFSCFAGEHWFCANRLAAEYLIEFHRTKPALANHYRKLDGYNIVPEESYYQTILCNSPHLKISQNHWRYIDWSPNEGSRPKTLLIEDLPKLHESTAHFARKFDADIDEKVLAALDDVTSDAGHRL